MTCGCQKAEEPNLSIIDLAKFTNGQLTSGVRWGMQSHMRIIDRIEWTNH